MARSENQKLKLLYLKELFETQSDEDHILSMQDIVSYLAARGIRAERKSVYADVACLQAFGMDIVLQKGPAAGIFWLRARLSWPSSSCSPARCRQASFCQSASRWR